MTNSFTPKHYVESIYDINHHFLTEHNIKGLMLDVDETILPRRKTSLPPRLIDWVGQLQAKGIKICILSNSFTPERIKNVAELLDLPYITTAFKPFPFAFIKALNILELAPKNTAIIGDQIFTDVFGGNISGLMTILVKPLTPETSLFRKGMRWLENIFYSPNR